MKCMKLKIIYVAFRHKTNLDFESNYNECEYDISLDLKMKNQYSTFSKTMQNFQRVGGLEGGLFDRGVLRC